MASSKSPKSPKGMASAVRRSPRKPKSPPVAVSTPKPSSRRRNSLPKAPSPSKPTSRGKAGPSRAESVAKPVSPRITTPAAKPVSRGKAASASKPVSGGKDIQTADHITISSDTSDAQRTVRHRSGKQNAALTAFVSLQSLSPIDKARLDQLPGIMARKSLEDKVDHWKEGIPPPSRSPSVEPLITAERMAFLEELDEQAGVLQTKVYPILVERMAEMEQKGQQLGYYTRKFVPNPIPGKEHVGLLVIGPDQDSVDSVFNVEMQKRGDQSGSPALPLFAGMVFGAVMSLTRS